MQVKNVETLESQATPIKRTEKHHHQWQRKFADAVQTETDFKRHFSFSISISTLTQKQSNDHFRICNGDQQAEQKGSLRGGVHLQSFHDHST